MCQNGYTGRYCEFSLKTILTTTKAISKTSGPLNVTLKRTLNGHNDWVAALASLPNGDLVSGSYDKTIKIWNTGS